MTQGRVNDKYEAVVPLKFYAGDGSAYTFTAVIDTGSEAEVVASAAMILLLQLDYVEPVNMKQADDICFSHIV